MEVQQHLDFKDLFPTETPLDITQYLDGISRNELIRIALLFIHVKAYDEARSYAITFTSGDNPTFSQYMLNRIAELTKDNPNKSYYVGSSVPSLKLLQYIYSIVPLDKTTKSAKEIVENITRAITLINQNNINDPKIENKGVNQDSIIPSIESDGGTDEFVWGKKIFCNQIVYSDFINYPLENLAIAQMLKADKFFKFSDTNPKFKILVDLFLKEYGCGDSREYLKGIMRLIFIVFESIEIAKEDKKGNYPIVTIAEGETFGLNLLTRISIDKNDILPLTTNYDSLDFRNKPLIKISNNEFLIINNTFIIERLYNSIKFNLSKINLSFDKKNRILSDAFSDYTTYFSEGYLFNGIIENIYKKYNYKLVLGGEGLCDYFVSTGNKIFLFECKDIEYASHIKQSNNFADIKEFIWEKLVLKEGKPIGAGQIIRDIREISDGTTKWENNLPKNLQIYPILVLGKPMYSTLGFNYIMNQWFSEELKKETFSNKIKINPLTIIDIDTLLLLEESLSSKRLKFETELESFYNHIKKKSSFCQKYLSFSDYIIEQKNKFIFSKNSQALFYDTLKQCLFGEKENEENENSIKDA